MEPLLAELQKVGFSQYESRAYVGLLQHSPVTGYELSKRSGIPRSMIYEVLGKLIDRGATYTVPAEPVKYAPVPARELIERLRRSTEQTLGYLESALGSLQRAPEVDVIWHIRGHDPVLAEMLSIVERARRELWLSIWAAQIAALAGPVRRAQERGVRVFSVLFEASSAELGLTFHHDYMPPDVVKARMGGHLTIAARDGEDRQPLGGQDPRPGARARRDRVRATRHHDRRHHARVRTGTTRRVVAQQPGSDPRGDRTAARLNGPPLFDPFAGGWLSND